MNTLQISTALLLCGALTTFSLPTKEKSLTKGDPSYFLPDNAILPIKYKVTINVTKSFTEIEKRTFSGIVEITALVNEDKLTKIVLHSVNNTIGKTAIKVNKKAATFTADEERQFLIITPTVNLVKGETIEIYIPYEGKLQDDMHGFYVSTYSVEVDGKPEDRHVLTTQFQPTHARKAFPCFDEPKYKAKFELHFHKQPEYVVMSNMNPIQENNGKGSDIVDFPVTPKMSTYLVAFIVSEFEYTESPYDSKFKVWSRPNALHQTKWAADYVSNITESLNTFTGIHYNEYIPKMDMAALPDFSAGAMENWGMLTYRETALLVEDDLSTNKDIERVITVIAHEVAHQWFGNLITCHWWSNTWLNEGFARYFQYFTTGEVLPSWEMQNQFVVEQQQSVFGIDALVESTPLTLDVYTPNEISSHFGSISYSKGGSVIRMMEHFIEHSAFQAGLQNYLNKNRLSNTEPQQLWSAIQESIDKKNVKLEYPLNKIMNTWISQAGYPVINVNLNAPGYFSLSQQRFYINPKENSRARQYWFVPISYTTSSAWDFKNTSPKLWLTPNEPTKIIAVDTDFIIVNVQESGYYRVNYDTELWQRIAEALAGSQRESMHPLNKAQLVDDVLNLARADLVDYRTAFNVTDFLVDEDSYYPWYSAFTNFRFLLQRYSDEDNTGTELRMYLKSLMTQLMKSKKFEHIENENEIKVLNRVQALEWACNLEFTDCISEAKELFKKFKTNPTKTKIPKNLRSVVYCTALRNGDKKDWDFLWSKYGSSNSAAEKIGILNALGCSSDKTILNRYLGMSIDPTSGIKKQDASYVFTAVITGGHSVGVEVAFQFLKANHPKIEEHYNGMNDLEKVTLGLAKRLTNKKQITEFKNLLNKNAHFATFREAAIETVEQNMAWAEKYSDTIGSILNKKRTGAAAGIFANKFVVIFLGFISIYFSMFN